MAQPAGNAWKKQGEHLVACLRVARRQDSDQDLLAGLEAGVAKAGHGREIFGPISGVDSDDERDVAATIDRRIYLDARHVRAAIPNALPARACQALIPRGIGGGRRTATGLRRRSRRTGRRVSASSRGSGLRRWWECRCCNGCGRARVRGTSYGIPRGRRRLAPYADENANHRRGAQPAHPTTCACAGDGAAYCVREGTTARSHG